MAHTLLEAPHGNLLPRLPGWSPKAQIPPNPSTQDEQDGHPDARSPSCTGCKSLRSPLRWDLGPGGHRTPPRWLCSLLPGPIHRLGCATSPQGSGGLQLLIPCLSKSLGVMCSVAAGNRRQEAVSHPGSMLTKIVWASRALSAHLAIAATEIGTKPAVGSQGE